MNLPKIRKDLLVQDLNDEVLVYDTDFNKSYCLNSTARTVFNACDGETTLEDLKRRLPEDIIFLSLDELKKNNLIQNDYVSPFAGINRREVIKKIGFATMVALPVVIGLTAPKAVHAASTCGNVCGQLSDCVGACPNCTNVGAFQCQASSAPCDVIGTQCTAPGVCNNPGGTPNGGTCSNVPFTSCTTDPDCIDNCVSTGATGTCA